MRRSCTKIKHERQGKNWINQGSPDQASTQKRLGVRGQGVQLVQPGLTIIIKNDLNFSYMWLEKSNIEE